MPTSTVTVDDFSQRVILTVYVTWADLVESDDPTYAANLLSLKNALQNALDAIRARERG